MMNEGTEEFKRSRTVCVVWRNRLRKLEERLAFWSGLLV